MNQIVPINGSMAPAAAQAAFDSQGAQLAKGFTDGVIDSFPVISIRGKIFRSRFQGEEQPFLDANGYAMPYLDVVLVAGSPNLSKVYYEKGFTEGDNAPPDCFSLNSVKPDPASPKRQAPACPGCPQNRFGSRITQAGKMVKACQDSRRIVVAAPDQLGVKDVNPVMIRIPQSSTKPLREYVEYLRRHRFMMNACITRLSFDPAEAYPKLKFDYVRPLTDAQYQHADYLYTDERTLRILEAPLTVEDADVSEVGGSQIPPTTMPDAPQQPVWTPPTEPPRGAPSSQPPVYQQPQQAPPPVYTPPPAAVQPMPPPPPVYTPPQQAAPPPPPPPPPAPAIDPQMEEFMKWKASQAAPQAAPQPPAPPPPPTIDMTAGQWQATPAPVPGPGWAAPTGNTQVSDAEVPDFIKNTTRPHPEPAVEQPQPEAPPAPKKRKAAEPSASPAGGAQQAPADLDKILSGLAPKAPN